MESDGEAALYNLVFENYLKPKKVQHYSRFTEKCASTAERVIRTIRNSFKKPVFLRRNADWMSELQSILRKHNSTTHHSTKPTRVNAFEKITVCSNLLDKREKRKPQFQLGQLF